MPIYAEATTTTHVPAPEGTHCARCIQMIDCGTQPNTFDPSKPDRRMVRISFELPDELREDGKPYIVSQKFALSMHEKSSLRKQLQSWRGKPFTEEQAKKFDISVLLGVPCLLSILHSQKEGKTYANIATLSPLVKGMVAAPQITPTLEFSLSAEDFRQELYDNLPDFLKEEIAGSAEYKALHAPASPPAPVTAEEEEGLPF